MKIAAFLSGFFCLLAPSVEATFPHFFVMDKTIFVSFAPSLCGRWNTTTEKEKIKATFVITDPEGKKTEYSAISLPCRNLYENVQYTVQACSSASQSALSESKTNSELIESIKNIPCYFKAKAVADILGVLYEFSQNSPIQSFSCQLTHENINPCVQDILSSWHFSQPIIKEVLECLEDSMKENWIADSQTPKPNSLLFSEEEELPEGPAYNSTYHKILMRVNEQDPLTILKLLHEVGHLIDAILAKQRMEKEGYSICEILKLKAAHQELNVHQEEIYDLFHEKYMHGERYSILLEFYYIFNHKELWGQYVLAPMIFERAAFFLAYSFLERILDQPEQFQKLSSNCKNEEYLYNLMEIFMREKYPSSMKWIFSLLEKMPLLHKERFFEILRSAFCEVLKGTWIEGFGSKYMEGVIAAASALQKFPEKRPGDLLTVVSEEQNLCRNDIENIVRNFRNACKK